MAAACDFLDSTRLASTRDGTTTPIAEEITETLEIAAAAAAASPGLQGIPERDYLVLKDIELQCPELRKENEPGVLRTNQRVRACQSVDPLPRVDAVVHVRNTETDAAIYPRPSRDGGTKRDQGHGIAMHVTDCVKQTCGPPELL